MSGGVSVNEAILNVTHHDMPLGGVGASGMDMTMDARASTPSPDRVRCFGRA